MKCDIKKFFANIDQPILSRVLERYIPEQKIVWLLKEILISFSSAHTGIGLPLGNLTSQLFVNIYMNEFDQFVKHRLRVRYYIRYADDFVFLSENRSSLLAIVPVIRQFLEDKLRLKLHPDKIFIKTLNSGIDFLGWVHFQDHKVLRTTTKRRLFKTIMDDPRPEVISSYLGLLRHGNGYKLKTKLLI